MGLSRAPVIGRFCHSRESGNPGSFSSWTEDKIKTLDPRLQTSGMTAEGIRVCSSVPLAAVA